jgi:hypothetical protein
MNAMPVQNERGNECLSCVWRLVFVMLSSVGFTLLGPSVPFPNASFLPLVSLCFTTILEPLLDFDFRLGGWIASNFKIAF